MAKIMQDQVDKRERIINENKKVISDAESQIL